MKVATYVSRQMVDENGYPLPDTQQFFDIQAQQMQQNLSDDGFVIPSQTTENIQAISNPSNPKNKGAGTFWYDTTINKFVGNENGTLVVFTTTPL